MKFTDFSFTTTEICLYFHVCLQAECQVVCCLKMCKKVYVSVAFLTFDISCNGLLEANHLLGTAYERWSPTLSFLCLTLRAPIMIAADDIHNFFFFHYFSEKIRLDVSSESSARQRIHMKNQVIFSLKDKSKKLKCHLLQFLFGALTVNLL